MTKRRACIFCKAVDRKITNEHVWAEWVSRLFADLGAEGYTAGAVSVTDTKGLTRRPERDASDLDLTVNCVCYVCNNEILGLFESDLAQPLISALTLSNDKVSLSIDNQKILAVWATKMAMVAEFAGPQPKSAFFTDDERERFINTLSPLGGTFVWLASIDKASPLFSISAHRMTFLPPDPRYALNITTAAVGCVALQVFSGRWREDGQIKPFAAMHAVNQAWREVAIPVWPHTLSSQLWPPIRTLTDDQLISLQR